LGDSSLERGRTDLCPRNDSLCKSELNIVQYDDESGSKDSTYIFQKLQQGFQELLLEFLLSIKGALEGGGF